MFDDKMILFFSKDVEVAMILGINILLTVVGVAIFFKRILKARVSEIKTRLNFLDDKITVVEDRFIDHISDNKKAMMKLSGEISQKLQALSEKLDRHSRQNNKQLDHAKQNNKQPDHEGAFPRPRIRENGIRLDQGGGRGKRFDLESIDVRLGNLERKVDLFFE